MASLSSWQQLYSPATPSPLQPLVHPLLSQHQIKLWVKRDDLLHATISGNKWRKLKYPLRHAIESQATGLLSFGGAYSNHLHALAAIGQQLALPTLAIVRGEASSQHNPTLTDARRWGMSLEFVDRQQYRLRQDSRWLAELSARYPGYYLIPEGGSCAGALPGVAELWSELAAQFRSSSAWPLPSTIDHLILPVASGGTLAGLISTRPAASQLTGYAVLKGASWLKEEVCALYPAAAQDNGWQLRLDHHGGGYAKSSIEDRAAIALLSEQLALPLEPIYSGKAILGLFRDIAAGYYPAHSQLVFLHTGGLQGTRSALSRKP
ncbi:1-aminocyclopropane-1-carboxylate deaminase/D-cysteine desulfhydrase [Oceanisphaera sp. IT1-181]|uniref:1-aminocyclopropane-1-carboxylate deaminase/D-cysteine desulfhydrase n=1 Tax=Oceanisphaera sp. IT1-181 TaxID=3081199 RepID=UPI0029CA15DE|nr:pyridoxal-phosphate dependent enzyme [Oceanisphaera sp. IT1-181]